MPIEFTPPRRLLNAVLRLRRRQRGADGGPNMAPHLTIETVESVNSDGTYQILGTTVGATGLGQLEAGQGVTVAWKQGKPNVIVAHQVQRAQFPVALPVGGPFVEMLLAAPVAAFASGHSLDALDIYFRNANQTTLLKCRAQLVAAGFTIRTSSLTLVPNAWGFDHRRFLVQFVNDVNSHLIIAIFTLSGNENTAITGTATAKLESTVDVGASTIPLGTMSWTQNIGGGFSGSAALVLGPAFTTGYAIVNGGVTEQTAAASLRQAVLTRDKHLIVSVDLIIANQTGGGGGLTAVFFYPYLIDLTAGLVLFNGIAQQGIWPGAIYNGAVFVSVGPGFFNFTGVGTPSRQGGAQFYIVPSRGGNFKRLFVGVRTFDGSGTPTGGQVQYYVSAFDITTNAQVQVFPLTTYPFPEFSHLWLLSFDQRYVMWMRAAPAGAGGGTGPFVSPFSATLTGYDFKEGLHVTDLGPGEVFVVQDAIPLKAQADIESLLDQAPYLMGASLLWDDHNDLRIVVPPPSSTARTAPEFVNFRHSSGTDLVVNVPFMLPLKRLIVGSQDFSTLKALTTPALQFIVDMITAQYTVSGHQDMVVGYSIFNSPVSSFVCVQTAPISGVTQPTA